VTSQAWDFDADLDFDRFGMTGFFEALTFKTDLIMSSSFIGCKEIGLLLSSILRDRSAFIIASLVNKS
jgi:hypothetical protein